MKTKEEIRETIRKTYGNVAVQGAKLQNAKVSGACCNQPENKSQISSGGCGCGKKAFTPEDISTILGYSEKDFEAVPEGANLGLGCGNPQTIASIKTGEVVVDLGAGGGFDCFLAAKAVGDQGRVIGVDMTPEMVARARMNKEKAAADNVEFRLGEIEHLPVGDNTADLIISNCVINLSPDKPQVYKDAFRVLKPGGRLAISDVIALKPLPEDIKDDLSMLSACIGGAATTEEIRDILMNLGFEKISITPKKVSQELINEWLPGSHVGEYVAPADIQASKPMPPQSAV